MAWKKCGLFVAVGILYSLPFTCPAGILYSTFVGGSDSDSGTSVIYDDSGIVYLTGSTSSPDFPTTPGAYDQSINGSNDVYIVSLTPELDQVLAGTLIGGSSVDEGLRLAFNAAGELILAGRTYSTDFPVTPGAWDQDYNGEQDIFIIRMSPELDELLLSTFCGGSEDESVSAVAVHPSGDVMFTGNTRSDDYPVSPDCYTSYFTGGSDIFVTRLSLVDGGLIASTYIPANGPYYQENGSGLVINDNGDVVVCGCAGAGFPGTEGAYDQFCNGGNDFVVFRMKPNLTAMGAGTFLGGSGNESWSPDMTLDGGGNIIITGTTESPNYPTTTGCWDSTFSEGEETVISILSPRLDQLLASTFGRPSTLDVRPSSVSVSDSGDIVLFGTVLVTYHHDAFVMSMTSALDAITSMIVYGGGYYDIGRTGCIDSMGKATQTGYTRSYDFPTTDGAFQAEFIGDPGQPDSQIHPFVTSMILEGYDTLFTGLYCNPKTITLPQSAYMAVEITNTTYFQRTIDASLAFRLPDGTVVEDLGFSQYTYSPGETFRRTWIRHFPYLHRLEGINTLILRAVDVTPAPWNLPPYPPSGHSDVSEFPFRIIVP